MKIFVDTNIFLDLILKRENFDKELLIFNAVEKQLFMGVILDITILNIDYMANKQIQDVREFLNLINIKFEIIGSSNNMMEKALKIDNKDLEDIATLESHCDLIITNDKNFYTNDLLVLTSNDFVKKYLK